MKFTLKLAAVAAAMALSQVASAAPADELGISQADRIALTGNATAPADWRMTDGMTFNGKTMDGAGRLLFETSAGGYVCSASLLKGGYFAVTAAHCADDYISMKADFGLYGNVAKESRTVTQAFVNPNWDGTLGTGADIAIIRLDHQITSIEGFNISTTNDLGKNFLITGYGTTQVGNANAATNWNEWGWGHFGYNTNDVDGKTFNTTLFGESDLDDAFGTEYIADYDSNTVNKAKHNTLQRIADVYGASWASSQGLGANEAIIAGGDSGGGDFVWNGSEWLLSGVHSWGWQICPTSWGCDISKANSSSWGDLSGSTAVFSHAKFIAATAVPEPGALLLALPALLIGGIARRRKSAR